MKHHSELINYLISKFKLKNYLEIGTYNKAHNFDWICVTSKICVDPAPSAQADYVMSSDDFFAGGVGGRVKYDLVFIDGLHHADQVKKDFDNALKYLKKGGFIIMHDCNPHSEHITHVPRDNGEWCGDVYKFASRLDEYCGIAFLTVDFDYGCTVVWKDPTCSAVPKLLGESGITWEYFQANKHNLLRLVTVDGFLKLFANGRPPQIESIQAS